MSYEQYANFPSQPGLVTALVSDGVSVYASANNTIYVSDLTAAQNIAASYNPVPAMQASLIAQVESLLQEKIAAGFTYNGVPVGILPADIQNITAMAATAMANLQAASLGITAPAWPSNFAWLPQGSGASLPLTAPEMITFGAAASHYVSSLILYADSLIAQIQAATTAAAVQAIDITAGWPTS